MMDFQTPADICEYMVSLIPAGIRDVLEPTPGKGNLVAALRLAGYQVEAPTDFFSHPIRNHEAIVMNPPFTPMQRGYEILYRCMERTDIIIALMPWLTLINSITRTDRIIEYGLVSVTHLPRTVFKGARVQTCILEMRKGFNESSQFHFIRRSQ